MRRFVYVGGSKDGQEVSIKHGKSVHCMDTNEGYVVYSEPLGTAKGVLIPEGMNDEQTAKLIAEKFPWSSSGVKPPTARG